MVFLDPTSGVAFKKLFDNMAHKDIVISFLNIILDRKKNEIIVDIVIDDFHIFPEKYALKPNLLHIKCIDQAKRHFEVEMQIIWYKNFPKEDLYCHAIALCYPLKSGRLHRKLVPELFVGFLEFKFLETSDSKNIFHILKSSTYSYQELDPLIQFKYRDIMLSKIGQYEAAFEKGVAIERAKKFLDILDLETIAKKTGLDIEIVKKLKSEQ